MCPTGKRSYRTKRKAIVQLEEIRTYRHRLHHAHLDCIARGEVAAYQCRVCGLWHLTSQRQAA